MNTGPLKSSCDKPCYARSITLGSASVRMYLVQLVKRGSSLCGSLPITPRYTCSRRRPAKVKVSRPTGPLFTYASCAPGAPSRHRTLAAPLFHNCQLPYERRPTKPSTCSAKTPTLQTNMSSSMFNSNTIASDPNHTNDVEMYGSTLMDLPPELIDMLAKNLKTPRLLSLRATCRKLRNESAHEFRRRYFKRVEISGTGSSVLDLLDMFSSPNFPQARQTVKTLSIRAPVVQKGWPIDCKHLRRHLAPNDRDIARLLAALPNLRRVKLVEHDSYLREGTVFAIPAIFIKGIAALSPASIPLRHLSLQGMRVNGNDLVRALEQNVRTLCGVRFTDFDLVGNTAWPRVLEALISAEVARFFFSYIKIVGDQGSEYRVRMPWEALRQLRVSDGDRRGLYRGYVLTTGFSGSMVKPALKLILEGWETRLFRMRMF